MQTSYPQDMASGFAGQKADSGFDYVASMICAEQIGFGLGVVKMPGEDKKCRLPIKNQAVILDDAGTWTAGDVVTTINGFLITTTFSTDKDTSMALIATALQALAFVSTAVYVGGSTHTITIVAENDIDLSVTVDVSGITGTMTITSITSSMTESLAGISLAVQQLEQLSGQLIDDKAVITFSGDVLTTSDTIIVTLNGVTLSTITYTTSEAVTLGLLGHLILAEPGVNSASVNTTDRTITILANEGQGLVVNSVVVDDDTVASVEVTAAIVHSSQNTRAVGEVFYKAMDTVNVLQQGRVKVLVEEAVTSDDSVYVRHIASGVYVRGGFRKSDASGLATIVSGARYTGSAAAGGIAIVEINFP